MSRPPGADNDLTEIKQYTTRLETVYSDIAVIFGGMT